MIHKQKTWIFTVIIIILTLSALAKSIFTGATAAKLPENNILTLNEKWDVSVSEKNGRTAVIYNYQIPDPQPDSDLLCLETYWSEFEVSLHDSTLYTYKDPYKDLGGRLHFIPLPDHYPGKMLTLSVYPNLGATDQTAFICDAFLSCKNGVLLKFLKENAYALIFGVLALLMAFSVFGMAAYLRDRLSASLFRGILYLGFYILSAGIWTISDSKILLLVTDRAGMVALISFLSFFCMPVFMIQFVQEMLHERRHLLDTICRVQIGISIAYLINYVFGFIPPFLFVLLTHACILAALTLALKYCLEDFKQHRSRELRKIVRGIAVFAVFILIALIIYYRNPLESYSYINANGLVIFMIFLISAAMEKSYEYMEQSTKADAYRTLAMTDEMTSLGNYRAFLEKYEMENPPSELAYIVMDVNNLKTANDVLGHQKGDELITATAHHIRQTFGNTGCCYRTGGDEFLVILEGKNSRNAEKLIDQMQQSIQSDNQRRGNALKVAIGYARRESPSESVKDVYCRADQNMYIHKQKMKEEA